jgi:hypothetical protein
MTSKAQMDLESSKRHVIARKLMIGAAGTTSEADWLAREQEFLEELEVQFPLESLKASEVAFEYQNSGTDTFLCALLRPQTSPTEEITRGAQMSLFIDDVYRLKSVAQRLKEQYESALKSSGDPSKDPVLALRRRRLQQAKGSGYLTLYTTADGERMPIGDVPRWMPNAEVVRVCFRVEGIWRNRFRVRIQGVHSSDTFKASATTLAELRRKRSAVLFRGSAVLGYVAGCVLLDSVDNGALLAADVHIDRSWATGQIGRWSVHEVPVKIAQTDRTEYLGQQEIPGMDAAVLTMATQQLEEFGEARNDGEAANGQYVA